MTTTMKSKKRSPPSYPCRRPRVPLDHRRRRSWTAVIALLFGVSLLALAASSSLAFPFLQVASSYYRQEYSVYSQHATVLNVDQAVQAKEETTPFRGLTSPLSQHYDSISSFSASPSPSSSPHVVSATTIVTQSAPTGGHLCRCELLSVDCLHAMDCLLEKDDRLAVAQGIQLRRIIRQVSPRTGPTAQLYSGAPLGKQTQFMSMGVWDHWVRGRVSSSASNVSHFALPKNFETAKDKMFLNSTLYEPCVENGWKGKACFFTLLQEGTEEQDGDELELDALRHDDVDDSVKSALEHDLIQYLQYKSSNSTDGVLQVPSSPPALGHLLSFSHILRILFHRRPHVQDFCRQRRQTFRNLLDFDININNTTPLTVSLHIRRADSCGGDGRMETRASPLDSPAQPTNIRKCYAMSVYMEALEKVLARVARRRPLEVYLSTDDAGSVLAEIQNNFTELYKSVAAWHVLDFDRDIFDYRGGVIESPKHHNHAALGEAAIADLWHLSHGQIFVGHLGSRFGKVGWFLATARHHAFVPFVAVDGHSVCCDIDEACALVAPFITSMEQCLTWGLARAGIPKDPKTYWTPLGSLQRVKHALGVKDFAEWTTKNGDSWKRRPHVEDSL